MPRLPALEGLRGLLALWVLFSHVTTAAGLGEAWRGPFRILYVGTHAVDGFIILSGFVIAGLIVERRESYPRFVLRRALRLYPAFLVCLALAVALLPLAIRMHAEVPFPHPHNAFLVRILEVSAQRLPEHIAAHLTLLHAALPHSVLPLANYAILHPAWSVSLEWQFYLLAPLVLWGLTRGRWAALAVIAAAWGANGLLAGPQGFLPRHVPEFAVGIASFFLWRVRPSLAHPLLPLVAAAVTWFATKSPAMTLWALVFGALLCPGAMGAGGVLRALTLRPMLAIGRWSYSVYLVHTLVITLALAALQALGAAALGQWPFFALLLALTLAGSLVASAALYRFVEAPAIALGRRPRSAAAG
jgi:peptidoglycan/LPS O-acetylase OafA/YrhL